MSTLAVTNPTLLDITRRLDANGKIDKIAEMLNLTNEILDDMVIMEGNLPTGHKTTIRTGLPSATWRLLNYGVQPSKSQTAQITDVCGMLEAYAEIDKALADLNSNTAEFRLSEDRAYIESMNQTMASTIFYGNVNAEPNKFHGLAPRYSAASATETEIGYNVIKAGGSQSDNTSIWLVVWGENTCHAIYPKGSKAGLQHQDLGEVTLEDTTGGKFQGYRSHYKWDLGLTVRDWRYVVRIANIDVGDLSTAGTGSDSSAALEYFMADAFYRIPEISMGRAAFYAHPIVIAALQRRLMSKSNTLLSLDDWTNDKLGIKRKVLNLYGVPIRKCQKLVLNESVVS